MPSRTKTSWKALAAACCALLAAGCHSSGSTASGAGPASPAPATSATTPASSAPAGLGSGAGGSPASARCTSAELSLSVGPAPGGGAAGSYGVRITFTNTSAGTCAMYGFPGVSYLTAPNGNEVNDPAQRVSGGTGATVNLAPRGTAVADVILVQTGNFNASACQPVDVTVVRVYPPDETTPLYASDHETLCSVKGTGVPQINPVAAPDQ